MTLKKRKILLLPSVAVPYMATLSRVHISPLPRWVGGSLLPSFPLLCPQSPEGSSHKHIFCELIQPTLKTGQSSGEFLPREAERT